MPILNIFALTPSTPSPPRRATSHRDRWRSLAWSLLAFACFTLTPSYAAVVQEPSPTAPEELAPEANPESAELASPVAPDPVEVPADLRRWLDEVETLRGRGELDGAREHLSGLILSDVYVALLAGEDAPLLAGLDAIDAAAKNLGLLDILRTVREERVRRLTASRSPDHPDLLNAKLNLAGTRYELGDLAGAKQLFEVLLAARERLLPPDHPDLLRAMSNLAVARKGLGDLAGARELQEVVLAARERLLPPDHSDLLRAKLNLAATLAEMGDFAGAEKLFEVVHAAWERLLPPDHHNLLIAKQNLASARYTLGDLAGAKQLYEVVLAAWERLLPPNHPDLLLAKLNLATTRYELGDLAGARELFEVVLAAWERFLPPDHPDLLTAKLHLAATRWLLGDLTGAKQLQEVVLAARERVLPPDHPDLLAAKLNLAATRRSQGDFADARSLEEFVLAARERSLPPDHPDVLSAKLNLAATWYELGDLAGAKEIFEVVLAARARSLPPDHPDLLVAKMNVAATRKELGDLAGARELEESVFAARERLLSPDHPDLLSAGLNLANTRYDQGDFAGVEQLAVAMLRGQVIRAQALRDEAPRTARASAASELRRLSNCLFYCEAEECEAEESELEHADRSGLEPELFTTLESLRSVSVGSSEVMRAAAKQPELAALLEERRRVRGALGDQQSAAPGNAAAAAEVEAWRTALVKLSEERDGLEQALRRELAKTGFVEDLPTAESVSVGLGRDALLIDFLRYDRYGERDPKTGEYAPTVDSLLAFVVTPEGTVERVELGPSAELAKTITGWRAQLGKPVERGFDLDSEGQGELELAAQLRKRLLDPCLAVVGGELPDELYVILDDFLYLAPFDALVSKDGKRLGELCAVHIEVTAQRLAGNRAPYSGDGILLALGGADFNARDIAMPSELLASATPPVEASYRSSARRPGSFGGLVQSGIEVKTLEFIFEDLTEGTSVVLTGAEASKQALFEHAPSARYLHLATHGWFAPETFLSTHDSQSEENDVLSASFDRAQESLRGFAPETLCGLALAGANEGVNSLGKVPGIITAEELSALDLGDCELAVLSACETNVGLHRAGQGIQSLQTALHAAGVRTAITSLWRVDDAAARRLMELFYTNLWDEKLPKSKALWQAKMTLRAEGFATKDWAGWVMTGDPR